jgi:ribosomal protein L11 methyltransferase
MNYLELTFSPLNTEEEQSLLIAELLEKGFESFVEEEHALLAYIPANIYTDDMIKDLAFLYNHPGVEVVVQPLEDKNWNKEWESNYQPVTIAGKCHVRAPFHTPVPKAAFEIVIEPKMAFGTAHHETTQLMAGWLMELEVEGKEVLDMGCGTGILAILANKMGARNVIGIDNDEWAWRNAIDNFRINGVTAGSVFHGDAALIRPECRDLIMANINRNVLLQDMKAYYNGLRKDGMLLLSGFYQQDIEAIAASASETGLHLSGSRTLNDWAVLLFYKKT